LHLIDCELEKGWKGIRVLQSTRTDVEKILGKPVKDKDGVVEYEADDAYFRVLYARKPCEAPETLLGGYKVSEGVVLQYKVQPKNDLKVTELKISESLYERSVSTHRFQDIVYFNRRHAVSISAFQDSPGEAEIVKSIDFSITDEQERLFACKRPE
jgi:hypothetical protein